MVSFQLGQYWVVGWFRCLAVNCRDSLQINALSEIHVEISNVKI